MQEVRAIIEKIELRYTSKRHSRLRWIFAFFLRHPPTPRLRRTGGFGRLTAGMALLLIGLFAPSVGHAYGESSTALALTREDDGKTINGHVGQTLVLTLQENPTTGFRWDLMGTNSGIISLQLSKYTQDQIPQRRGIVGAGGQRVYVFKLNSTGTTNLELFYKRPWEPVSVDRFSVILDVAP